MRHSKLADRIEEVIAEPAKMDIKLKVGAGAGQGSGCAACPGPGCCCTTPPPAPAHRAPTHPPTPPQADAVDIAYPPVVQSGGDYDLRLAAATSKDTHIHYGVIVTSLGARCAGARTRGQAGTVWARCMPATPSVLPPNPRPPATPRSYASYCANVGRTYFVDPSKEQEAAYAAVQEAQAAGVAALVEGAPMSAAYEAVVAALQVRRAARVAAQVAVGPPGSLVDEPSHTAAQACPRPRPARLCPAPGQGPGRAGGAAGQERGHRAGAGAARLLAGPVPHQQQARAGGHDLQRGRGCVLGCLLGCMPGLAGLMACSLPHPLPASPSPRMPHPLPPLLPASPPQA